MIVLGIVPFATCAQGVAGIRVVYLAFGLSLLHIFIEALIILADN